MQGYYPSSATYLSRRRQSDDAKYPSYTGHHTHLTESPQSASHQFVPSTPWTPRRDLYGTQGDTPTSGPEREFPTVSQGSRAPLIARDYASGSGGPSRGVGGGGGGGDPGSSPDVYFRQPLTPSYPDPITQSGRRDDDSFVFVESPKRPCPITSRSEIGPPSLAETSDERLLPRQGPQDAYLRHHITPLAPLTSLDSSDGPDSAPAQAGGEDDKGSGLALPQPPPMLRAASAPGIPALQPSPMLDSDKAAAADEGTPIFDIFGAQLDGDGRDMVARLKGHLEGVLRMQEEVGRMHLSLEGLGPLRHPSDPVDPLGTSTGTGSVSASGGPTATATATGSPATPPRMGRGAHPSPSPGRSPLGASPNKKRDDLRKDKEDQTDEVVKRREQAVEDIMARLGDLSAQLQTYHHLGTPKLSFPQSSQPPSAHPFAALSQSQFHSGGIPGVLTQHHSASQSHGQLNQPASTSAGDAHSHQSSSPDHVGYATRRLAALHSSPLAPIAQGQATGGTGEKHRPKVHSNLVQVVTADDN